MSPNDGFVHALYANIIVVKQHNNYDINLILLFIIIVIIKI